MGVYPGPQYLVSGEPGSCEHGVPDNYDCCSCLARTVQKLEERIEELEEWVERLREALEGEA